jgi:predicted ester cyclase
MLFLEGGVGHCGSWTCWSSGSGGFLATPHACCGPHLRCGRHPPLDRSLERPGPYAAEELLAPEFVRHDANLPDVVGPQAERKHIAEDLAAFPDLHFEIEQLIAEGDLVAARYLVQGTHQGEFLGIPGGGRQVRIQALESYRLADGKLAEQWVVMDALGLLQQLGAVPGPG